MTDTPRSSTRFAIRRSLDDAAGVVQRSWTWAGIALFAALVVGALVMFGGTGDERSGSDLQSLSREELELEKLRQEITNLEQERNLIASLAPYLAAAAAISGALLAWRAQIAEHVRQRQTDSDQREKDRQQEAAELAQRKSEMERRMDENFAAVASSLGNPSDAIQASAAISLLSFLRPGLEGYVRQVFLLVLANVKVDHTREVSKLLVRVFERALRLEIQTMDPDERALLLDMSDANLDTVDLSGLDLSESDLGFASLQYAKLRGANLNRVRGYDAHLEKASLSGVETNLEEARLRKAHCVETNFHDANLTSARLEEADLTGAEFYRARLQSAHLDETILCGTRFDEADVNDAFFRKLRDVDQAALRSLSRAKNWRKAHFDRPVLEELERLSGAGSMPTSESEGTEEAPNTANPADV